MIIRPEIVISLIACLSLMFILTTPWLLYLTIGSLNKISSDNWILSLLMNTLSYATVLIPVYLIYAYVKASQYLDDVTSINPLQRYLRICFTGQEPETKPQKQTSEVRLCKSDLFMIPFCFFGILSSYLTWGFLQEKIMTQKYTNFNGDSRSFKDSQFLVFVSRVLSAIFSGVYLLFTDQPRHTPPLYKYSYASISNIMSTWCQYEALKFVSFPAQTLAKSSKIITVMIMGKIISRRKYESYEYAIAVAISVGMGLFLFGDFDEGKPNAAVSTISGYVLLIAYLVFDSFTSIWQSDLFIRHRMSPVQMMCGVNMFSCVLLFASLTLQGTLFNSFEFMTKFPTFICDSFILSISSAIGQFFLFVTISYFGPVVCTIFMTVRQVLSILLSYYSYSHPVTYFSILGGAIVFVTSFVRLYCDQRLKARKRNTQKKTTPTIPVDESQTQVSPDNLASARSVTV